MKSKRLLLLAGAALLVAFLVALLGVLRPTANRDQARPPRTTLSISQALGNTDTEGYARAFEPRTFTFPADHGPHPAFRTEWWYFTGNLRQIDDPAQPTQTAKPAARARRFGFQLTFFRNRLAPLSPANEEATPSEPPRASAWATDELYMAHFALTDIDGGSFHAFERFARPVVALAGAQADPFHVWLEDWSAQAMAGPAPFALPPVRLLAARDGVALDLVVTASQPRVLQGEEGLSRKSATPGNASYYYSFTRLRATGEIELAGRRFEVAGSAWMDREWSTSALAPDQVGWDWFSLQLDDNYTLMIYRLRRTDGTLDPASAAVLIDPTGTPRHLAQGELTCEIVGHWRSPASGALYPLRWKLRAPALDLELEIEPHLDDQELRLSLTYWEGAVAVAGSHRGQPVQGNGYLELTGY